ncbi:MAG: Uma2 family endonuclease [Phycisphaerae bacterium]|nr:Uma2 family endonuclease [Phycisphaerae bacterium]
MPLLVNDAELEAALIAERQERGSDHHDEVWDGVYVMAPLANNEHQTLATLIAGILVRFISESGLGIVQAGANVSDQPVDWTQNYRVPDVLVFLNGNAAEDRNTHWFGGPDFAIEIVSPKDRSREKFEFYANVGVRELLLIDREPWQLELFRLVDGQLQSAAVATEENGLVIASQIVPITMKLVAGLKRPAILINAPSGQSWQI